MAFELHIPEDSQRGRVIQKIVDQQHLTPEQVLEHAVDEGLKAALQSNLEPEATAPRRSYASFFGSVKGPGAHGSPEAIDRYIAELRNEW